MVLDAISLRQIHSANFRTTRAGDELNNRLMAKLGLKMKYEPARLAIGRSLSCDEPVPKIATEEDEAGKTTIAGRTLFGEDDLPVWIALIIERADLEEANITDVQDLVKRHWHRGIVLLHAEWEASGEDFDKFILQLASRAGVPESSRMPRRKAGEKSRGKRHESEAVPVDLAIGDPSVELTSRRKVSWLMNGRGNSPHVAIMGTLGTGKTRTAAHMWRQLRETTGVPVILFDMAKGDLARDGVLARDIGAQVLSSPKEPVPLDVLAVEDRTVAEATDAAMRFRESFERVTKSRPGGAQLDALRDAAQRAFMGGRPVRITDIRDALRQVYEERRRRDDSVTSTFNDLTSWNLFEPTHSPAEFFSRSWIIDVSQATETAQRFIVFLVLDALYTYQKALPDSALDSDGHRALRLVIGIDEARKVLGYSQPSLMSLVRESRSKGLSVFLISQSPDDFDAEQDNFLENVGLALCFKTNATASRVLRAWLGQQVDLGGLGSGIAVTRLPGQAGVVRIRAWE